MATTEFIHTIRAVQYTGSNVSEIVNMSGGVLRSNTNGVLEIADASNTQVMWTISPGDWWDKAGGVWTASAFAAQFFPKADALKDNDTVYDPTALTARVAALEAKKPGTADIVSISVPILLLGGTVDRPVVWARPFPDASYNLSYAADASTIGKVTPSVVAGTKTASGVTIRLTAGLAVSVLGVVHVLGTT